jgi:hypothetical protein
MTPQERQMIDDLFDRLARLESAPRDPDAVAAISQGLRKAPSAPYALVQTVLVQDEALKRANSRIQELEAVDGPARNQSGGFLDSMREAIFGQDQPHGSVPNVPPPANRPVWNSGQVAQQFQSPGQYGQASYGQGSYGQGSYGQGSYGQGSYAQPYGGAPMGGGGSFLGTAAAAAAGMVGGSLLLGSIRNMMGGSQHGFGDASGLGNGLGSGPGGGVEDRRPWADQSNSDLARDAGINDIGSSGDRAGDHSRAGLFDTANNDDDSDADSADVDSDDFGGGDDNGSDYA